MAGEMVSLVKERVPWWFKICAKVLLSRLPLAYHNWRVVGIFQHGFMLDAEYAINVFGKHYAQVQSYLSPGYTTLELGPGDSLATAAIAATYGAGKTWLVDAGSFAITDIKPYQPLFERLDDGQKKPSYRSVQEMLNMTNATYLTSGLQSLTTLPSDSVDFIFSQAVLEHVALAEFEETICELHRLQKPAGVSSHRIDLQDHLGHSLHSLRFSHSLWESRFFARSGFYTNRLRASQIVDIFTEIGYEILSRHDNRWGVLPLERSQLHPDYSGFSDDDLLIRGLDLVVRKP